MQDRDAKQRIRNLGLVAIAGQTGCITTLIVLGALLLGLWLDSLMGTRGPFIIGLLILSVPFSLYAMLRISLSAINRIQHTDTTKEKIID